MIAGEHIRREDDVGPDTTSAELVGEGRGVLSTARGSVVCVTTRVIPASETDSVGLDTVALRGRLRTNHRVAYDHSESLEVKLSSGQKRRHETERG